MISSTCMVKCIFYQENRYRPFNLLIFLLAVTYMMHCDIDKIIIWLTNYSWQTLSSINLSSIKYESVEFDSKSYDGRSDNLWMLVVMILKSEFPISLLSACPRKCRKKIKNVKGVFSKPSGNCIVSPNLCFLR